MPDGPTAPRSSPPCPGSITTVIDGGGAAGDSTGRLPGKGRCRDAATHADTSASEDDPCGTPHRGQHTAGWQFSQRRRAIGRDEGSAMTARRIACALRAADAAGPRLARRRQRARGRQALRLRAAEPVAARSPVRRVHRERAGAGRHPQRRPLAAHGRRAGRGGWSTVVQFGSESAALRFEKFLKTGAGRALARQFFVKQRRDVKAGARSYRTGIQVRPAFTVRHARPSDARTSAVAPSTASTPVEQRRRGRRRAREAPPVGGHQHEPASPHQPADAARGRSAAGHVRELARA